MKGQFRGIVTAVLVLAIITTLVLPRSKDSPIQPVSVINTVGALTQAAIRSMLGIAT